MNERIDKWLSLLYGHFEVKPYVVRRSRKREHYIVRAVGMYLLRKHIPHIALRKIGKTFGGQDHSTVIYAIKQVKIFYMDDVKAIEELAI